MKKENKKESQGNPRQELAKNVVLVSAKPLSSYIFAARKIADTEKTIILKSRGKNIGQLVNLAEVLKREGYTTKSITTDTEKFTPKESNREVMVSCIEYVLDKA